MGRIIFLIWVLLGIHVKELRVGGKFSLITSIILPIGFLWLVFNIGLQDTTSIKQQIISGMLTMACLTGTIVMVANKVILLRIQKGFDAYLTFPVSGSVVLFSIVLAFCLYRLPIVSGFYLLGKWFLNLSITVYDIWVLLPIFMALILFGLVGVMVGYMAKDLRSANLYSTSLVSASLTILPVFYSINQLPIWHQTLAKFTPVYYLVEALNNRLANPSFPAESFFTSCLVLSIGVGVILIGFSRLDVRKGLR